MLSVDWTSFAPFAILGAGLIGAIVFASLSEKSFGLIRIWNLLVLFCTGSMLVNNYSRGVFDDSTFAYDMVHVSFGMCVLIIGALSVLRIGDELKQKSSAQILLMLSLCGALVMVFSNHLLVSLLGLEVLSIPLYVLTGFGGKKSTEAAFKYFLLGSIASALFIFGLSFVWGASESFLLIEMKSNLLTQYQSFYVLGLSMMVCALLFKVGIVPFHFWVPDVYEAAPSSVVSMMSGVVKLAAFSLLLKLLQSGAQLLPERLSWILIVLALLSIGLGAFGGLKQKNLKRLLGYSTLSHSGFILLGTVLTLEGVVYPSSMATLYYTFVYALTSWVAFEIFSAPRDEQKNAIEHIRGLKNQNLFACIALTLTILSMAGIPPLGGFWAKFQVLSLLGAKGYLWVVVLTLLFTVVALGYYLNILVKCWLEPAISTQSYGVFKRKNMILVLICCALVVLLGVFPEGVFNLFPNFK